MRASSLPLFSCQIPPLPLRSVPSPSCPSSHSSLIIPQLDTGLMKVCSRKSCLLTSPFHIGQSYLPLSLSTPPSSPPPLLSPLLPFPVHFLLSFPFPLLTSSSSLPWISIPFTVFSWNLNLPHWVEIVFVTNYILPNFLFVRMAFIRCLLNGMALSWYCSFYFILCDAIHLLLSRSLHSWHRFASITLYVLLDTTHSPYSFFLTLDLSLDISPISHSQHLSFSLCHMVDISNPPPYSLPYIQHLSSLLIFFPTFNISHSFTSYLKFLSLLTSDWLHSLSPHSLVPHRWLSLYAQVKSYSSSLTLPDSLNLTRRLDKSQSPHSFLFTHSTLFQSLYSFHAWNSSVFSAPHRQQYRSTTRVCGHAYGRSCVHARMFAYSWSEACVLPPAASGVQVLDP